MNFLSNIVSDPESFPYWGLSGTIIVILGCAAPSIFYKGRNREGYSPLNHFISELGERKVSRFAAIFNYSLIIAGILFAFFMVELGRYFGTSMAALSAAVGVFSSISCIMVGLFPMDRIEMHMIAAISFFYSGMSTMILFAVTAAIDLKNRVPGIFIYLAAAVSLTFIIFLLIPRFAGREGYALDPSKHERQKIWLMPLMEWLVLLGTVGWIAIISVFFLAV